MARCSQQATGRNLLWDHLCYQSQRRLTLDEFEAGALSKRVGDLSRVSPLLLDLEPAELVGPLTHFQVTRPQRDDVARLVKSINSFSGEPLSDARVEAAMESGGLTLTKNYKLRWVKSPRPKRNHDAVTTCSKRY